MGDLNERNDDGEPGNSEECRRGILQQLRSIVSSFLVGKSTSTPTRPTTDAASHPNESGQEQPLEDEQKETPDHAGDQPHGDGNGESERPRIDDTRAAFYTPPPPASAAATATATAAAAAAAQLDSQEKVMTPPRAASTPARSYTKPMLTMSGISNRVR